MTVQALAPSPTGFVLSISTSGSCAVRETAQDLGPNFSTPITVIWNILFYDKENWGSKD